MRRSGAIPFRWALLASVGFHIGAVGLAWLVTPGVADIPPMRVYAVDIVSPPPQSLGEPDPGGGGTPAVEEETPEPEPVPEPEPEPEAPAPEPEPAPPVREAPRPREPSPPAQPTTPEPAPAQPPAETPAPRPGGGTGEGSGASTGARPDPTSAGGEDIDVHLRGVQCPSPAYCANIVRQLYRYFRPPSGASTDAVEVFFWINQDGTASEMRVVRSSGSFPFQLAALEAVEQAGNNRAFGPLPGSFQLDRLPVSFYFRPAR